MLSKHGKPADGVSDSRSRIACASLCQRQCPECGIKIVIIQKEADRLGGRDGEILILGQEVPQTLAQAPALPATISLPDPVFDCLQ
jgi:hypothetical protein